MREKSNITFRFLGFTANQNETDYSTHLNFVKLVSRRENTAVRLVGES